MFGKPYTIMCLFNKPRKIIQSQMGIPLVPKYIANTTSYNQCLLFSCSGNRPVLLSLLTTKCNTAILLVSDNNAPIGIELHFQILLIYLTYRKQASLYIENISNITSTLHLTIWNFYWDQAKSLHLMCTIIHKYHNFFFATVCINM